MKTVLMIILASLSITLIGCNERQHHKNFDQYNNEDIDLHTVFYRGHSYIIVDGDVTSGICHDEACQCKTDTL